jgi:hypothetical protein
MRLSQRRKNVLNHGEAFIIRYFVEELTEWAKQTISMSYHSRCTACLRFLAGDPHEWEPARGKCRSSFL